MKKFENIVYSYNEPSINSLWIKDDNLKYFSNGSWKNLGSSQENGDAIDAINGVLAGKADKSSLNNYYTKEYINNNLFTREEVESEIAFSAESIYTDVVATNERVDTIETDVSNIKEDLDIDLFVNKQTKLTNYMYVDETFSNGTATPIFPIVDNMKIEGTIVPVYNTEDKLSYGVAFYNAAGYVINSYIPMTSYNIPFEFNYTNIPGAVGQPIPEDAKFFRIENNIENENPHVDISVNGIPIKKNPLPLINTLLSISKYVDRQRIIKEFDLATNKFDKNEVGYRPGEAPSQDTPFRLGNEWFSFDEIETSLFYRLAMTTVQAYSGNNMVTTILFTNDRGASGWNSLDWYAMFAYCTNLKTLYGNHKDNEVLYIKSLYDTFNTCKSLKYIYPILDLTRCDTSKFVRSFNMCESLRSVYLKGINAGVTLNFKHSPNLSLKCVKYMIENRDTASTDSITITLHQIPWEVLQTKYSSGRILSKTDYNDFVSSTIRTIEISDITPEVNDVLELPIDISMSDGSEVRVYSFVKVIEILGNNQYKVQSIVDVDNATYYYLSNDTATINSINALKTEKNVYIEGPGEATAEADNGINI